MKVKTKKRDPRGITRLETYGEIKEVIISEDLLNPKEAKVALCFRGENSSGIIELSPEEIKFISKELSPKISFIDDVKVMKFRK